MKNLFIRASTALRALVLGTVVLLIGSAAVFLDLRMQRGIASRFDRQLTACGSTLAGALSTYDIPSLLRHKEKSDSVLKTLPLWQLLRDVQERNDLTYVYTFLPTTRGKITYVVDGSPDGEACTIGQEEDLPEENVEGLDRAWSTGTPFVSGILEYNQWGLLKVSAVPVLDTAGRAFAFVGADLNISAIRKQVRMAVLLVVAISLIALALGGWFSWRTERTLLAALERTRGCLASVASGETDTRLPETEIPAELREVNRMWNRWLGRHVHDLHPHRWHLQAMDGSRIVVTATDPDRAGCIQHHGRWILWMLHEPLPLLGAGPSPSSWWRPDLPSKVDALFSGVWEFNPEDGAWIPLRGATPRPPAPFLLEEEASHAS
ncbi:MAG: hypothetical protein H6686_11945 [Fibrobacteria bacterium]|nr:hypothetical protein [Fibrobacteria bacterium]